MMNDQPTPGIGLGLGLGLGLGWDWDKTPKIRANQPQDWAVTWSLLEKVYNERPN